MKKLSLIFLTLTLLLTAVPSTGFAAKHKGKFIVVVINYLTLEDLENNSLPHLNKMITGGGLGLMNTNTGGSRSPKNTYSTIANGTRSLGTEYGGFAFNVNEQVRLNPDLEAIPVTDLYRTITGKDGTGQVLHLGLPKMTAANSKLKNRVKVAALGTTLKANGIRAGVFGNSDSFDRSRLAALLAIDDEGQVAKGNTGSNVLQPDKTFPFGFHTNYAGLKDEILRNYAQLDYIVIETGDHSRLEEYKSHLTTEQYRRLKIKTLKQIDSFLGDLDKEINWQQDRMLIISPTPAPNAAADNNVITPVIFKGQGIAPGFLTSNSTRRQGIVANTDIAPTILDFWGIEPPPEIVGRSLSSIPSDNTFAYIKQLNKELVVNYTHRPPVLKTFVILQIIYILFTAFIILFVKSPSIVKYTQNFIIIFLIMPLLMLGYKIFRVESLFFTTAQLVLILSLFYWLLSKTKLSFYDKLAFLALFTSLGILTDTLLGSKLVMNSPMGYDPVMGARYYGIGNEFSGILMGSTIISIASIFQLLSKHKKWLYPLAVTYFIFLTYVLYSPHLGADAGGLIVAVISLGFFSLRLAGKHIRKKDILWLLLLTVTLLSLGAFVDMTFNQSRGSHIGQAFSLLVQGNWAEIGSIITRKIAMNIKLINYSIWTKVLLASLAAMGVLLYRPVGFFKRLADSKPYMKKGFEAVFVASLVGFIVNDSGIVQAATTFIYLMFPLLHISLTDKLEKAG